MPRNSDIAAVMCINEAWNHGLAGRVDGRSAVRFLVTTARRLYLYDLTARSGIAPSSMTRLSASIVTTVPPVMSRSQSTADILLGMR